jgi:hypothetical protein
MKRVKRIGVFQTSKVVAIIMFFISLIFMIPFVLIGSLIGEMLGDFIPGFYFGGGLFFIFIPFSYGIFGFISTAISCLIYNLIAKWTGGIELEFDVVEEVY